MKSKLLKNTIYLYMLTVIKILFPLITSPYLTRILTVDNFGVVAYVKAYVSYVQLLIDFGFILSATKSIVNVKDDKTAVGILTGNAIVEKSILAVIAMIITAITSCFTPILGQNKLFVWLYFLSCAVTILIPDYLYRGLERMEYAAIPLVLSKVAVIIFTFLFVKGDNDILLIPTFEIIGNLIAGFVSLAFLKKLEIRIRVQNFKVWFRDIKESSVYFFSNFATTFFGALTTLVVGFYMNKTDIAHWALCMQIVSAAKAMYSPVANSLYPYMIINKDLKLVRKVALIFTVPLALGVIIVLFFGEQVMVTIGGEGYSYAGYILKYLLPVLITSFYSMLYGWPILGVIGKEKETTISTVSAAVIQVVGIAGLVFSNSFNLISLAICCGVSELALLIVRLWILYKNRGLLKITNEKEVKL